MFAAAETVAKYLDPLFERPFLLLLASPVLFGLALIGKRFSRSPLYLWKWAFLSIVLPTCTVFPTAFVLGLLHVLPSSAVSYVLLCLATLALYSPQVYLLAFLWSFYMQRLKRVQDIRAEAGALAGRLALAACIVVLGLYLAEYWATKES